MPVIGFLDSRSPDGLRDRVRQFRQGMREIGYVEGENAATEYRWAEGQFDRLPVLAAELVRRLSSSPPKTQSGLALSRASLGRAAI